MKSKERYLSYGILALAIIVTIFISGCIGPSAGPSCPTCPNLGQWSDCINGIKSRTNYKCDAGTNYSCTSYTENKTCLTEINLKSGALEATVSPTADETVKGIVKVEAAKVPQGTTVVAFILAPGAQLGGLNLTDPNTQIVRDITKEDGWKALFDTTKVENGIYTAFVGASYEGAPEANPWIAYTGTQVVVKN